MKSPIQSLITQVGENQAKAQLRAYFSNPDNIEAFSRLFTEHVPTKPPKFHGDIYKLFTKLTGNTAIAAPRGFSKSTIADLVLLAWVALHAKRRFIILISDTFTQATMQLESLKAEMEGNEFVKWLYGDVIGEVWATDDILLYGVNEQGERLPVRIMSKGAGMKIRGLKFKNFRPDLIIIDDLENEELVASEDRRRKLRNWLVRAVLPALAPNGIVIMIGTVLHRLSLLNIILDKKEEFTGWQTMRLDAWVDENKTESLWPERFSPEHLTRMESDPNYEHYIGPIAFSQEMRNRPISEDDQVIKVEWINSYSFQGELNKYHAEHPGIENASVKDTWVKEYFSLIIGHVDPAISEKTTADYWAMATIGVAKTCPICVGNPPGHILQLDMVRMREGDPTRQVNVVLDQYQEWKHDKIKIETVQYQQGLYQLIKRISAERNLYAPVMPYKPDRDKLRRARIISASFAGNLIHLRDDHPLYHVFKEEILAFPQGEHDDMFDSFMGATEEVTMKAKSRTFKNKPSGF